MENKHKGKAIKGALERHEHEVKNHFNKHLKHQKRTNKKLGLDSDFGMRGIKPMQ